MNQQALQTNARRLESLLLAYAPVSDTAKGLLSSLSPYLNAALNGEIDKPLDSQQIPGRRTFDESNARNLPGLEDAYSKFKLEATGGEPLALKIFKQRHGIAE